LYNGTEENVIRFRQERRFTFGCVKWRNYMNAISVSKSAQFGKTRRVHPHACVQYGL
jgi:hypothetical protein